MAFEVKIPSLGESVTEAVIGTWMRKDGDVVSVDDPIVELESDKANMELVAEAPGTLEILRREGENVSVGDVVARIVEGGAVGKSTPGKATQPESAPVTAPETRPQEADEASPRASKPASPAVRRIVEERGLDLSVVEGTGPGGRVTKADALRAVAPAASPAATARATPATSEAPASAPGGGDQRRVPMSRLRQVIARRLVEAQQVAAILTTFNEVDLTAVQKLRASYKEDFKARHDVGLGYMSFFVKACCAAAAAVPELNAQIDGTDIVYDDHVHMGVAVGTERGLVVPVVRRADQLSFAEVEREITRLAALARDNKLSIDDLSGATFTISNGGVYGSLLSTPILTPPQSGILGMHKIEKRPVVVGEEIQIRPMMYLALSYDHRIVDGEGAVTFLVRVKEALEDPARLLLGV